MKWFPLAALIPLAALSSCNDSAPASRAPTQLETPDAIPELMDAFGVSGLAVTAVSGDRVLLASGYGQTQDGEDFSAATRCGLFSATKTLTSLTYAKLAEQGRLDVSAPLGVFIEDAPPTWAQTPFYRLLNHSSGITMVVNKDAFEALASDPTSTNASVYALIRDEPLDYQAGEFSRYRQSGYAIGEMIVQDEVGKPFAQLVDEIIVDAAGLTSTAHPAARDKEQAAILLSAGGFETSAEDMGKLIVGINDGSVIAPQTWKNWLLDEDHRFGDYSLGSVIEEHKGVLTLGHSGGGARANFRYAPDEEVGAMVCTDDRSNNGLAITLARMLIDEIVSGQRPALPLLVALSDYQSMSGKEVIAAFQSAKDEGSKYDLSETEALFNTIGYTFLEDEKLNDAVDVLRFNAVNFPNSPNAHDSLGEALLTLGDIEGALTQYERVLELDPGNVNATKMLEGIRRKIGSKS
ncbi:MAG: serine hydrolase [Pseudomonadota bacterium]